MAKVYMYNHLVSVQSKLEICDLQNLAKLGLGGQLIQSNVVFCLIALWFPDVSFFFAACAEFCCLISLSESVLSLVHPRVVHLHHNILFGCVSPNLVLAFFTPP